MKYSENIILSDSLNADNLSTKQKRILEIGSLNLEDFNSKILPQYCQLMFGLDTLKFSPKGTKDDCIFISQQVNYFVDWDIMKDYQTWSSAYIKTIENTHYKRIESILATGILREEYNRSDFEYLEKQKFIFKTRFYNYFPKGFLNEEQKNFVSYKLNELCNELDFLFNTYKKGL